VQAASTGTSPDPPYNEKVYVDAGHLVELGFMQPTVVAPLFIGMLAFEKSSSQAVRALAQPSSSASAPYRGTVEGAVHIAGVGMQLVMVVAPFAEV
jgi:hypothetical protein